MASLQGYVKATYDEIVEALGEPTYDTPSGDGKVETEWRWEDSEYGVVTIYDWKEFDGGATSRSGMSYRWHIGGNSGYAVDVVSNKLDKLAYRA